MPELKSLNSFIYDFAKTVDYQSLDEAKQENILLLPEGRKPRTLSPRKFIAKLLNSKKRLNPLRQSPKANPALSPRSEARQAVQRFRHGFTVVEIMLSLFIFLTLITILFAVSRTLLTTRGSNLQTTATKIAVSDLEKIRTQGYTGLPPPPYTGPDNVRTDPINDPDFQDQYKKLPAYIHERQYQLYSLLPDKSIIKVRVNVKWDGNGDGIANKIITLETLVYQYGI